MNLSISLEEYLLTSTTRISHLCMSFLSYYKNVRREWASLVAAPPTAKFQDALAFTRSIGDFHLHIYGNVKS